MDFSLQPWENQDSFISLVFEKIVCVVVQPKCNNLIDIIFDY